MTSPKGADKQRSFTGDKLDWMAALSADPRLDARSFEVGFQIAQHVNKTTGVAVLSDETISDKTSIPRRWVARARAELRRCKWIDWKRTKTANIYWTLGSQMNLVTDRQIMLKDARDDRRKARKKARQVMPQVAHLKAEDMPPPALPDAPQVAYRDWPQVANIHLSENTVVETPSKDRGLPRKNLLREEGDSLDIPAFLDRRRG